MLLEAWSLLGKAELDGAGWRENLGNMPQRCKRPERERLRLLKPYSSLALDGREFSMAGNSSGLSLGSPKPLLGFLRLSLSFPGLWLGLS